MSVFGIYARYYDLLYRRKDYEAEADYVDQLIRRHSSGGGSLLELGCGTGKHAELLSAKGYDVLGLDRSEEMLSRARARAAARATENHALEFQQADIRRFDLDRRFDVIISLFHVVSYLVKNDDLEKVFENVRRHLAPGGLFVFDCWYGPAVLSDLPAVRVLRLEDDDTELMRVAEPAIDFQANRVDVHYEIMLRDKRAGGVERIKETHSMRYLFQPEIEGLLQRHELQLVAAEEWISGKAPGRDTWGVCFVGRG